MTLPDQLFFTVAEATERWGKSKRDILHWGVNGVIKFYVYHRKGWEIYVGSEEGFDREAYLGDTFLKINQGDVAEILINGSVKVAPQIPS